MTNFAKFLLRVFACIIVFSISTHSFGQSVVYMIPFADLDPADGGARPLRPKVPLQQQIICYYEDGVLDITFAVSEGNCSVKVYDIEDNIEKIYHINSDLMELSIYIGELSEAMIEVSTSLGRKYEGFLTVE